MKRMIVHGGWAAMAFALGLGLLGGLASQAEAGPHKMTITFGGYTNKAESLANFPVLVVLSNGWGSSSFNFSNFVNASGYDLRFYTNDTDTGAGLDYEIDTWDTNSASCVWVRVPVLASTGLSRIWAKWGDAGNSNQLACTTNGAVWTNGYVGVWHLNESGSVNNDSVGVNNFVTNVGTVTYSASSRIGGGWSFSSSSGFKQTADNATELDGMTNLTMEGWFNSNPPLGTTRPLLGKRISAQADTSYTFFYNTSDQWATDLGHNKRVTTTPLPSSNAWHFLAISYSGNSSADTGFFMDGALTAITPTITNFGPRACRFTLGAMGGSSGRWQGTMDEVRISNVPRTTNWLWACHQTVASNTLFSKYGTMERILPTVSLTATVPSAYESATAPTSGVFTVSRGTWTAGNSVVGFRIGSGTGAATPGPANDYTNLPAADYAAYTGSVTIADGQTNATIAIWPVDDPTYEGNETVTLALTNSTEYTIGTLSNAIVTIYDDDSGNVVPVVAIPCGNQTVLSNALPMVATLDGTITDDGQPSGVVTQLWMKISGPGTVTFGNATNIDTTASFDAAGTYVLQLLADDTALQATSTCTIDAYLRTVSVQPTDATCGLTAGDKATFQVSRPATGTNEALTVNYALSGATSFVSASPSSGFTLAAGQTSTNVTLTALQPNFSAATNVYLTLVPGFYAIGASGEATGTVAQVTTTALTLGANAYLNGSGQLISDADQSVLLTATSGTGASGTPYVFDVGGYMNLANFTIRGATNNTDKNQFSATWQVWGGVSGNGNFDSYVANSGLYGGHVRIDAFGNIALGRVLTRANNNQPPGNVYLWAKDGSVTVTNVIDTRVGGGTSLSAGSVTIRSEGALAGQGIAIQGAASGTDSTTNSILAEAYLSGFQSGYGGAINLYCQTNITLAGGVTTRGGEKSSGAVLILGSYADANLRAAAVSVGRSLRTDGTIVTAGNPGGGNVTIKARSLHVAGDITTAAYCYLTRTGNVDLDLLETATIDGVIDTRMLNNSFSQGSPGYVKILARHTRVNGTDASGYSIRTWPGALSSPASHSSAAGDADITLTNANTSAETYDPLNPTNSLTSSVYVAGKIEAGRWHHDNAMGNIRISAVEVLLGGNVISGSNTASSVMAIHYGVTNHNVITHLVENGVRWNGTGGHSISYTPGSGSLSFSGDVPYAGALEVSIPGTIYNEAVTNVTASSALFRGHLQEDGSPAVAVSVRWGDGAGNLDHTNGWSAGHWGDNTYPQTNIATLTANENVYYTFVAENAGGTNVASPTQYFITGPLTVVTGDGICGSSFADTATIAIARPGGCTAGPLTVNYELSGAGASYIGASPASGFTLVAGQAGTNITFTLVSPNTGVPAAVTLTLLAGAYPSDALAADSITVATITAYSLTAASDTQIGNAMDVIEVPPDTVGVTIANSTNRYDFASSRLNLNGKRVYYAGGRDVVLTNLSALTDSGGGRIDTFTAVNYVNGGSVGVHAFNGIALGGANGAGYAIDSSSTAALPGYGGEATLSTTGGVAFATGGIRTRGESGGRIWITDGANGSAGNVTVAGTLDASSSGDSRNRNGSVVLRGAKVSVSGNVLTDAAGVYGSGKPITMVASSRLSVGGYLASGQSYAGSSGNGGAVALTGGVVIVSGSISGMSIATWVTSDHLGNVAGDIRVTATEGHVSLAGGVDASHPAGVSRRGAVALAAPNGWIRVGSLDANRFKSISFQTGSEIFDIVRVSGALTNFVVSEAPKRITFPTGSSIGSDIYYDAAQNVAIPLSGTYDIYVDGIDSGKNLTDATPPVEPTTVIQFE